MTVASAVTSAQASASDPALGFPHAIYGERQGRWRLDSLFDDRDLAMFESQQLAGRSHYSAVKLESHSDSAAGDAATTTIFQCGGDTAPATAPSRRVRVVRQRSGRAKVIALAGIALAAALLVLLGIAV